MFTPARIFAALDLALKGTIVSLIAASAPTWLIILLTGASLFCGGIVAVSGPVQASATQNAQAALARAETP